MVNRRALRRRSCLITWLANAAFHALGPWPPYVWLTHNIHWSGFDTLTASTGKNMAVKFSSSITWIVNGIYWTGAPCCTYQTLTSKWKTGATVGRRTVLYKWFKAVVDALLYTHWKNRGPLTYCCRPKAYPHRTFVSKSLHSSRFLPHTLSQ